MSDTYKLTDEQMRDLVKECGLDWHRGFMPLFDDDPTNRYAVLIAAATASLLERIAELERELAQASKDAERLNTLDQLSESYGFQDIHEGNRWMIEGPFKNVRAAIDAMKDKP